MQALLGNEALAYRQTMIIVGAFLFVSAVILFVAAIVSRRSVDYRLVEGENDSQVGSCYPGELSSRASRDLTDRRINTSDLEGAPLITNST